MLRGMKKDIIMRECSVCGHEDEVKTSELLVFSMKGIANILYPSCPKCRTSSQTRVDTKGKELSERVHVRRCLVNVIIKAKQFFRFKGEDETNATSEKELKTFQKRVLVSYSDKEVSKEFISEFKGTSKVGRNFSANNPPRV
jgi:transcription elongation factor Elf1